MGYYHEVEVNLKNEATFRKLDINLPGKLKGLEEDIDELGIELADALVDFRDLAVDDLSETSKAYQKNALSDLNAIRSQNLLHSINVMDKSTGFARIGTDVEYAQYVNEGRGPVVPIHAKALHYFSNGMEIFSQRSGPADPRPYFENASNKFEPYVDKFSDTYLGDLV